MNGKSKCKILKDIRRQIAQDNDIAYVTSECKFQGDCSGTCPKCEAELRYLEEELRKRQQAGKAIAVAGIAATLMVGTTGCTDLFVTSTAGVPAYEETQATYPQPNYMGVPMFSNPETDPSEEELDGDIALPLETELMGEPVLDETELMGDLVPDETDGTE